MNVLPCLSSPCFIESQILAGDPEGWIFETKISPLVREKHELYATHVTAYLDLYCTSVLSQDTADDDTMMWGSATTTRYRMHEQCPGSDVAHRCISPVLAVVA